MSDVAAVSPAELIRSRALPWAIRRCFSALLDIRYGSLDIVLPDGRIARFAGPEPGAHARFSVRSYGFVRRLAAGDVGFAEGYIAGEWSCDDLVSLLGVLAANQHLIDRFAANPLVRAVQMARHWLNRNSREGSRRNIHAHYDLGNAFYAAFLDATMTYSAGLDVGGDLAAAQHRKYAAVAAAAGIGPQDHVLEIGCGWGGFAEYAARHIGCRITALTISREQFDHATARIAAAGLPAGFPQPGGAATSSGATRSDWPLSLLKRAPPGRCAMSPIPQRSQARSRRRARTCPDWPIVPARSA